MRKIWSFEGDTTKEQNTVLEEERGKDVRGQEGGAEGWKCGCFTAVFHLSASA